MVESQRHEDKATTEQHFFVSSLKPDTDKIAPAIRPHCKIENGCHWVLDVTFREDDSADPPTPGSGDCRRCATSRTSVHVAWPHGRAVTPRRESIPGGSVAASLLLTGVTTQPRVHAPLCGCPPRGSNTTQPKNRGHRSAIRAARGSNGRPTNTRAWRLPEMCGFAPPQARRRTLVRRAPGAREVAQIR